MPCGSDARCLRDAAKRPTLPSGEARGIDRSMVKPSRPHSRDRAWEVMVLEAPPGVRVPAEMGALMFVTEEGVPRFVGPLPPGSTPLDVLTTAAKDEDVDAGIFPGWPGEIRVANEKLARQLRRPLLQRGVRTVVAERLPAVESLVESVFDEAARAMSPEGALGCPYHVEALYDVAGRIAALAPWNTLDDSQWLRLEGGPAPFTAPVACVLGLAGQLRGIALYETLDDAVRFRAGAAGGAREEDLLESTRGILLSYDEQDDTPASVREMIERAGLRVHDGMYPVLGRYTSEGLEPLDSEQDAAAALDALSAILAFLEEHPAHELVRDVASSVTVASGRRLRVRYEPADDFEEDELEEGDSAEGLEEGDLVDVVPVLPDESALFAGDYSLQLAALPSELLEPFVDIEKAARSPVLLLKMLKREGLRAAGKLAGASSAGLFLAESSHGERGGGVLVWFGEDDERTAFLGALHDVDPEILGALAPGSPVTLVVVGGGATRTSFKARDILAAFQLTVRKAELEDLENAGLDLVEQEPEGDVGKKVLVVLDALDPRNERNQRPAAAPASRASLVGRNDPCPCGSGKKYKRCCLGAPQEGNVLARAAALHRLDRAVARLVIQHALALDGQELLLEAAESLPGTFGEQPIDATLTASWLLHEADVDGRSLAARLIQDRGSRLSVEERNWIELQSAPDALSVWEVTAVDKGTAHVELQDLLRPRRRVVVDQGLSSSILPHQCLLARLVEHAGVALLCGTYPVPLTPLSGHGVVEHFRERELGLRRGQALPRDVALNPWQRAELLSLWHEEVVRLSQARENLRLQNTDGDPLLLTTDRFAVAPKQEERVRAALLDLEGAESMDDDGVVFLTEEGARQEGMRTEIGSAIFQRAALELHTNSIRRADALRARVESVAGQWLERRGRTHSDPQSSRAARDPTSSASLEPEPPPEALAAIQRLVAAHMASWVDEPVPALDGLTPRQAAASAAYTARLDVLLKELELGNARQQKELHVDVAAIRRELGM